MPRNTLLLSIFASLFIINACGSEKAESENNRHCSDSGSIFSLIINDVHKNGYKDRNNTEQIAVSDSTHAISNSYISFSVDSSAISYIKKRLSTLESTTLTNFWDSNGKKISLAKEIQLDVNQVFASQVEYCPRYLNLSNVGFNENCEQALITYHYTCGPKCGYQQFVLLVKESQQWEIANTVQTIVH